LRYLLCPTSFPTRRSSDLLAALQGIERVGINLTHHGEQRVFAREIEPLLAVSREAHVVRLQCERRGDADGLLARAFDVERGLALDRKSTRLNSSHVKISYA